MNILAYEDIQRVEEQLISIHNSEARPLILPSLKDLIQLNSFQSQLFKPAPLKTRTILDKKLNTRDILVSMGTNQENAAIRMFIYNLFVVIYGPQANHPNPNITHKLNSDLLNNLKCSLYCKDIRFSQIQNSKNTLKNDQQAQMLAARFFNFLEQLQNTVEDRNAIIKCIQWVLQLNQTLLEVFILFMRFILTKLQVQGAKNYRYQLKHEEAIINLIQYFDLSYRYSDGLILFYQEGYFLTFVTKEIVFGQYYHKAAEMKYLTPFSDKLYAETPTLKKSQSQVSKKSQNQHKLTTHILTSSCQSENYQNSCSQHRESKKFHFQRRRQGDMESGNEKDLRKQFAKVISDSDCGSQADRNTDNLDNSNNLSTPPTPTWSKETSFAPQKICQKEFRSTIQLSSNIFRRKMMDPIHQVDQGLEKTKKLLNDQKNPQNGTTKNLVKVVDRGFQPSSPQGEKIKNQCFGQICDQNFGYFQENTESFHNISGEKIEKRGEILQKIDTNIIQCHCFQYRLMRNSCHSKTVEFTFQPQPSKKQNNPNFFSHKNSINVYKCGPQIKITPPKETKDTRLKNSQTREDRIPAFLKSKKERTSQSSKGARNIAHRQKSNEHKEISKDSKKGQIFKRYSQIILNEKYKNNNSSSSLKHNHSNSSPKNCPQQGQTLKKFDVKHFQTKHSLGQPQQNWKKNSNFYHSPTYNQNITQFGQFMKQNEKSNTPFRFFAPVQIIAPTVYLHSTNRSQGQVFFNVNKQSQRQSKLNESLLNSKGPNMYTSYKNELNSNRSEKILNSFQQKYL